MSAIRGKNLAFTGTFENMNRAEVVQAAKRAGALVLGRGASMSKNVDVLVTGDSNVGVKKAQAKHLGVQVLPAHNFVKFVRGGGAARVASARMASPVRRPAPVRAAPVRRQQMDFEEDMDDFEEDDSSAVMPWEKSAQKEAPMRQVREVRRAAPVRATFRPARNTSFRAAPTRVAAPQVRRMAYRPFWELKGKTVAFTGTFEQVKKPAATVMAERNGAKVRNNLNVDILVCGKGSEAKRLIAKKQCILAVSEQTFLAACRK